MCKRKLNFIYGLVLALVLAVATPAKAESLIESKRLWGNDRYETCAEVVNDQWTSSDYAVIVNGENFPDALSASALAKKYNAPILLTQSNKLDTNTLNELKRLKVKNVFIVGGDFVVNKSVEQAIKSLGIQTTRYSGQDRNETSVKVAEQIGTDNGIIVSIDDDFIFALSASPMAGKLNMPIILVPKDRIPTSVKNFISSKSIPKTYVLGGSSVISDEVISNFPSVERIVGTNTYENNIKIIEAFADKLDLNSAYLAYSEKFADALSGSAPAALNGNPIILVGDKPSDETLNFIRSQHFSKFKVLGGEAGISKSTLEYLEDLDAGKIIFKDTNFEKNIRDEVNRMGKLGDETYELKRSLYKEDVQYMFSICIKADDDTKIKDITGIENLTGLEFLDLENSEVSDISCLRGLNKLILLKLDGNQINDISALKELSNLRELDLSNNQISDVSVLKGLTKLTQLNLAGNPISDEEKEKLKKALPNCNITF